MTDDFLKPTSTVGPYRWRCESFERRGSQATVWDDRVR
jgi:hypothetical protein